MKRASVPGPRRPGRRWATTPSSREPGFVDTSVVVRYLAQDDAAMAAAATRLMDSDTRLYLTDGILAEIGYVLTSVYKVHRAAVIDLLLELVAKSNVEMWQLDEERVTEALLLCRDSGRVSFADAMLWAAARSSPTTRVYSFDQRFPREGIDLRP